MTNNTKPILRGKNQLTSTPERIGLSASFTILHGNKKGQLFLSSLLVTARNREQDELRGKNQLTSTPKRKEGLLAYLTTPQTNNGTFIFPAPHSAKDEHQQPTLRGKNKLTSQSNKARSYLIEASDTCSHRDSRLEMSRQQILVKRERKETPIIIQRTIKKQERRLVSYMANTGRRKEIHI